MFALSSIVDELIVDSWAKNGFWAGGYTFAAHSMYCNVMLLFADTSGVHNRSSEVDGSKLNISFSSSVKKRTNSSRRELMVVSINISLIA